MPLTRYEIRNEYSLANPDLYRAAAKDDPEGLLEGVAMAGLVGVVRQLGDLAEFAAEVFHDLHEEVLATAARGHELLIRVQQLEAELPVVEKTMAAETNYVNFAYNPGVEWHANIQNDQNHFTQGDLPRFIRNAYEDCRGPPRLFLLDKFDVAGAGACLKRYTDPSFFRMEWASSELMKAEKEQKARRIKKKGRRQRNGEIRDTFLAAHMQPRMRRVPSEVENKASTSVHAHISKARRSSDQEDLGSKVQGHEQQPASSRLLTPEREGPNAKASTTMLPQDVRSKEASSRLLMPEHQSLSAKSTSNVLPQDVKFKEVPSRLLIPEQEGPGLKATPNVVPQDAKSKEVFEILNPVQDLKVNTAIMESSDSKPNLAKFDSEEIQMAGDGLAMQRTDLPTYVKISEDVADDFASETDNFMDALTTMDSEVETESEVKTVVELCGALGQNDGEGQATVKSKQVTLKNLSESDLAKEDMALSSQNTHEEFDASERAEPAHSVGSPQANHTGESKSASVDDNCVSPPTQPSRSSTPISGSFSSMPLLENSGAKSEEVLESESAEEVPETPETPEANKCDSLQLENLTLAESAEGVPETPETPEANECDTLQLENLTLAFHQLPEPAVPLGNGSQMVLPDDLGSLSAHLGVKTSRHIGREFSSAHVDKHAFADSESEASEGIKESFSQSSANSSIQPMKWAADYSRHPNNVLDSDDELEGMQVSSSSSSSALSSPRPSALATTVFNTDFDNQPPVLLSPQESVKSSSESLLGISPRSAGGTSPSLPVSFMTIGINPSEMTPYVVQTSTHASPSYQQSAPDYVEELKLESKLQRDMAVPAPGYMEELELESKLRRDMAVPAPGHLQELELEPKLCGDMAVPAQNLSVLADEPEHFPPPPPLPPLEWRMTRRFSSISSSSPNASVSPARPPASQSPISKLHESSQAFKPFTFRPLAPQSNFTIGDELIDAHRLPTPWNDDSQDFSKHAGEPQATSGPPNLSVTHETSAQAFQSFSARLSTPSDVPGRLNQLDQPFKASRMGLPALLEVPMRTPEASTTRRSTSQSFFWRSKESLQSYRPFITEFAEDNQNDSTASVAEIEGHHVEDLGGPLEVCESNPLTAVTNKGSTDSLYDDWNEQLFPSSKDKECTSPPRREESLKDLRPPLPSSGDRVSRPMIGSKVEMNDPLIAAIASHDKSTLKKVPEWSQSSRTPPSDDREGLLEQIRTGSFSLRHTKVKKQEIPRSVTNINVAAILEKANAIRQAFAGSDEDDDEDDWSDS